MEYIFFSQTVIYGCPLASTSVYNDDFFKKKLVNKLYAF